MPSPTPSRSTRRPSSNVSREFTRQRSCANTANSVAVDRLSRRRAERGALRQGAIETTDFDRAARARPCVFRTLEVGAELEDVLASEEVSRETQRLNPLVAAHVALLIVEEAATLRLRRVNHRSTVVGFNLDLEAPQ